MKREPKKAAPKNKRSGEYSVGYRRPPRHTQFKAGNSGNPKGRPKGSRSIGSVLQEILRQTVSVTEGGKTRRLPVLEVIMRQLTNDAMRSDQPAIKLILSLLDRYGETQAGVDVNEMLDEDKEILTRYLGSTAGFTTGLLKESDSKK